MPEGVWSGHSDHDPCDRYHCEQGPRHSASMPPSTVAHSKAPDGAGPAAAAAVGAGHKPATDSCSGCAGSGDKVATGRTSRHAGARQLQDGEHAQHSSGPRYLMQASKREGPQRCQSARQRGTRCRLPSLTRAGPESCRFRESLPPDKRSASCTCACGLPATAITIGTDLG